MYSIYYYLPSTTRITRICVRAYLYVCVYCLGIRLYLRIVWLSMSTYSDDHVCGVLCVHCTHHISPRRELQRALDPLRIRIIINDDKFCPNKPNRVKHDAERVFCVYLYNIYLFELADGLLGYSPYSRPNPYGASDRRDSR